MSSLDTVAMLLVVVGALNWGLVGLTGTNLVESIFGMGTMLTKVVYILVGAGGVLVLWGWFSKMK